MADEQELLSRAQWPADSGLLPAIVQDADTLQVLMLGYMNRAALETTLQTGRVTFFSRTKQRLWTKGESSGHVLDWVEIKLDCDADSFLIAARPHGPTCHTGSVSCFTDTVAPGIGFLAHLRQIVAARAAAPAASSYTSQLLQAGVERTAQKVGEEGVETAVAAAANTGTLAEEAADLLYHVLVLLESTHVPLDSVLRVLRRRHQRRYATER